MAEGSGNKKKGKKLLKSVLSGGFSGGMEVLVMYPTEFVKTLLQLQTKQPVIAGVHFTGPVHVVKYTIQTQGFFGLYKGMSSLLYFSIPKTGVRFLTYNYLSMTLSPDGKMTPLTSMVCGMGAGAAEAIVAVAPMETLKVKIIQDRMSASPQYRNVFHGMACIIRTEGLKGIYQGVLATVAKQGSNQAIRFSVFNPLKNFFSDGDPKKDIGVLRTFLCGGLAGAASVFGNTPVDVVKSRLQSIGARERYRSTWHCVQETWSEGGVRAFYKGTTPRLARVVLNVALTFTIFDQMMKLFDKLLP